MTRRERHTNVEEIAHLPAQRPGRMPGPRPLTALLIAGRPEEAELYGRKLRLDGYSVVPAAGMEQGLEAATGARPDLIFVCLGTWGVPALVLLVLRSDRATQGVPTILVSDRARNELAAEVGGLLATENVVPRSSAVHAGREEMALSGHAAGCGRRAGWEQWLRPHPL